MDSEMLFTMDSEVLFTMDFLLNSLNVILWELVQPKLDLVRELEFPRFPDGQVCCLRLLTVHQLLVPVVTSLMNICLLKLPQPFVGYVLDPKGVFCQGACWGSLCVHILTNHFLIIQCADLCPLPVSYVDRSPHLSGCPQDFAKVRTYWTMAPGWTLRFVSAIQDSISSGPTS